jgi:hypothetical protein
MGGTVQLGRAEQRDVVPLAEVLHELRHELLGREAAEAPILWRHDDVETAVGVSDLPLSRRIRQQQKGTILVHFCKC